MHQHHKRKSAPIFGTFEVAVHRHVDRGGAPIQVQIEDAILPGQSTELDDPETNSTDPEAPLPDVLLSFQPDETWCVLTPDAQDLPLAHPGYLAAYAVLAAHGFIPDRFIAFKRKDGSTQVVQSELFRSAHFAQAWADVPPFDLAPWTLRVPTDSGGHASDEAPSAPLVPCIEATLVTDDLSFSGSDLLLRSGDLLFPGSDVLLRSGDLLLLSCASLSIVQQAKINTDAWSDLIAHGIRHVVIGSREPRTLLSDGYLRLFDLLPRPHEIVLNLVGCAAFGCYLATLRPTQSFLSLEHGFELDSPCRTSVWTELDAGQVKRVAVGGQVKLIYKWSLQ